MNKAIEFCGYLLTDDEVEACMALLQDIRAKKDRDRLIRIAKKAISFEVSDAIDKIGLEETKRIIRELNRELREKGER